MFKFNNNFFTAYKGLEEFSSGTELKKQIIPKTETIYKEDSGFGAYIVEDEKENVFRISGVFVAPLNLGQSYEVNGITTKYREEIQLKVNTIKNIRPMNKKSIILYLQSLKGLKSKAKIIYDYFELDSINVLLNNPKLVAQTIPGIGIKSALKWKEQLVEFSETQSTISTLLEYGITIKESKKLYDKYKDLIIQKIEANPYFLAKEVKGYGFERCDRIAREIGIEPNSIYRLNEGTLHCLKTASMEGHCFLTKEDLIERAKNLLHIKLSFLEMERFRKDYVGKSNFDYYIGEKNVYKVDYVSMCSSLSDYNNERSCYKKELHRHLIVEIKTEELLSAIDTLIAERSIIIDEDKIYLKNIYLAEVSTTNEVKRLAKYNDAYPRNQVETIVNNILSKKGISLEDKQLEACIEFNLSSGGFYVLDGSAGTGKTFTLLNILETNKELLKINKKAVPKISIFAPTGRASKVASVATKMNCKTIHKGLGFIPGAGFEYNRENPLDSDIIICDETSMLDILLADDFLQAIKNGAKVIFIGDVKQLPSVGAGNVLNDIISSGVIKVITLNVIKRQGLLSGIVENANFILEGSMVKTSESKDAFVIKRETVKGFHQAVVDSVKRILTFDEYSLDEIQVLAPQRTGSLGIYLLNYLLQNEFNPETKDSIKFLSRKFTTKVNEEGQPIDLELYFRKNDKIININNNYDAVHYKFNGYDYVATEDTGITNGEIGKIVELLEVKNLEDKTTKKKIITQFEDYFIIYEDDFSDLELAYALTIHKSQGSAWKACICPVATQYWNMLENNLFYTAVTRARDFLVMIGNERAFKKAITTHKSIKRNTFLKNRLMDN